MSGVDEAAVKAEEEIRASKVASLKALGEAAVKAEEHRKAMQSAYDDALLVQSACNLSGVVNSFARHMDAICEDCRGKGTEAKNTHPVVRLFVTQLLWLSFGETIDQCGLYSDAHDECVRNASPKTLAMLGITPQPELQPAEVPSEEVPA